MGGKESKHKVPNATGQSRAKKKQQEAPTPAAAGVAVSGAQPAAQAQPGVVGEAQTPRASLKQTPSQVGAQQVRKVSCPPPVAAKPNSDRQSLHAQVLPLPSVQEGFASTPSSPAVPLSQEQMLHVAPVAVVQPLQQGGDQGKVPAPNRSFSTPEQFSTPVAAAGTEGQLAATIGPGSSGVARADPEVHEPAQYINVDDAKVMIPTYESPACGVNGLYSDVASSMNLFLPNLLERLTTLTLVFLKI